MATYYLDPVGGNDASAGTSFATRWQSITSGATAARIAPGDTIRVIASPDPTSLGQNATWTDGSRTVTLTSAVTATITDATAAWTAVTNTSSTTSTNRKLGSTSSSLSVTSTFTTGKSHSTTTGTLDLSGYQQITFWIMQTAGTLASADGEISLKLCSDTAGATAVNTFNIPRIRALNQWQAFTIDNAAALGSAIQSVGFYINTDRAAQTFLINNIQAVKASSSADSLSLTSLIGKNSGTEGWFAIDSISGTSVTLRTAGPIYNLSTSGTPSGYSGTTATVTTYKREPLNLPSAMVATAVSSTTFGAVQEGGTSGAPITFSGGWDRTAMSSQTGDTYINGVNGFGFGLYVNALSYVTVDKLNFFGFDIGAYINGASTQIYVTAKDTSCNSEVNVYLQNNSAGTTGPINCFFTIDNANCAGSNGGRSIYMWRSAKNCKFTIINCNSSWLNGFQGQGDGNTTNPCVISNINAAITNVRRNGGAGVYLASNVDRPRMSLGTVEANSGSGVYVLGGELTLRGGTFGSNGSDDIGVDGVGGSVICIGTTLNSTTKYTLWEPGSSQIKFQKYQNTADDHRQYFTYGSILSDATTRHTASGISWKISPTDATYVTSDFPMVLSVGKVAVGASTLVTAKVWVNRSNTGLTTKFVCRGGQIAGVSSDVSTTASGSASTWEQLTITFTPSEAGVVELEVQAYGGTTYSVYVDDLDVTQA